MEIKLTKRPKSPIIISGFPGFGMVGTIATEFLIEHLKTENIGRVIFEDMPALVALHGGKVVEPFGIFYSKQYNLIIVHSIGGSPGSEWKLSAVLLQIAKELGAREIISLEGIGSADESTTSRAFFYASQPEKARQLEKLDIEPLKEGIIMGVTSALLLKRENLPVSCIFAETHSKMPDSKAAAKVIETLDGYLGLKVDTKPLLKMAQQFEAKLKGLIAQTMAAKKDKEKKSPDYFG